MEHEFKLGDVVRVLVDDRRVKGKIVNIKGETATVVVPVYYSGTIEYITVESKLDDLWDMTTDIEYFKDKKEFMDVINKYSNYKWIYKKSNK